MTVFDQTKPEGDYATKNHQNAYFTMEERAGGWVDGDDRDRDEGREANSSVRFCMPRVLNLVETAPTFLGIQVTRN